MMGEVCVAAGRAEVPWARPVSHIVAQLGQWLPKLTRSAEDPGPIVHTMVAQCRAITRAVVG